MRYFRIDCCAIRRARNRAACSGGANGALEPWGEAPHQGAGVELAPILSPADQQIKVTRPAPGGRVT
jgi:hypothetical protein